MDSQHNTSSFMSRELSGNPAIWESEWMSAWWQGLLEGKSSGLEGIGIWEDQFVNDSLLSSPALGDIGAEDEGRNGAATDNEALFDLNQPVGLRPDWLIGRLQQPDWGQILAAQSAAAASSAAQPEVVVSEVVVESNGAQPPAATVGDGTTPPASQSSAASAGQPIRYEVEDWTLSDYRTEALSFASGGESIRITAASGSATTTFNEPTGRYTVVAGFFDESDGVSSASLEINGQTLASWQFDDSAGGDGPTAGNLREVTLGSDVQLSQGDTLTLLGTQGNWEYARVDYIDFIPVASGITVSAALGNDTGTSNSDGLTNDSTITGSVGDVANLATLQARLDRDGVYVDITDLVQPDGSFSLSLDNLNNRPGNVFNDGAYTVDLVATDTSGNTSAPVAVTFSLDRTTPELTLTSPLISGDNDDQVRLVGNATEGGTLSISVDGGTASDVTVGADGAFDLPVQAQPLTPGTHQLTLNFTDIAGNVSQSTVNFTVADSGNGGGVDVSTDELVMHLAFDETSGTAASDSSPFGNDNDGTLISGSQFVDTGTALQGAVRFDGDDDHVMVETSSDINGRTVSQRTIAAWFKVDDKAGQRQVIFESGGTGRGLNMYIDGGQLYVGGWRTDQNWNGTFLSTDLISSDTWHHVTLVLDADDSNDLQSGAFRAYLDGTQFGSGTGMKIPPHTKRTGIGGTNLETRFHTGAIYGSGRDGLGGSVADVKLYNRVLSTDEIASLASILSERELPTLNASLSNDTGVSNTDDLTSDSTIVGSIGNATSSAVLQARLGDSGTYTDITNIVQPDGSFTLALEDLSALLGEPISDGPYSLDLQVVDVPNAGGSEPVTVSTLVPFTLDRTALELSLNSPVIESDPPKVQVVGNANEAGFLTVKINGSTAFSNQSYDAGAPFDIVVGGAMSEYPLTLGDHQLVLTFTDLAGNVTESVLDFSIPDVSESLLLEEGTDFQVVAEETFTIPEAPSVIRFSYTDFFDTSDGVGINDAFEVALLDDEGRSLVHSFAGDQDAFFNLTEGMPIALAAGVSVDGQVVTLDVSDVAAGTEAHLVFRLVNNDDDTESSVQIENIELLPGDDNGSLSVVPQLATGGSQQEVDFNQLEDVSGWLKADYGRTSFNKQSRELRVEVAARNEAVYEVRDQLLMVVERISDASVAVVNADGRTPDGRAYIDLSARLGEGVLAAGEVSEWAQLVFRNPNGVQFEYELSFLSQLNDGPEFISRPELEAVAGQLYQYDADAVDSDGDTLSYSLVGGPDGVSVDGQTGEIVWTPAATDVGSHQVTIQVEDGHGGLDEQSYTLTVQASVPNRPPVITTTPVVDATVAETVESTSGKIIISNDEWTLSNNGFAQAPENTKRFVNNIANFFVGDRAGKFLGYSNNFSLGSQLAQSFADGGHEWTVSTSGNFDLESLQQYDGVFVGGFPADNQVLIDYVKNGGHVYLFAGTVGFGTSENEAQAWQPFLNEFGLEYDTTFNEVNGVIPIDAIPHPIFDDIEQLFQLNGNSVIDLDINDAQGIIVARGTNGQGLYAVYDPVLSSATSYLYDVDAQDPDQDVLTYKLTDAPEGMWIEAETGKIHWQPTAEQLGLHEVTVEVSDGQGGVAEQQYSINVTGPQGNRAPVIVSDPVVEVQVSSEPRDLQLTATIRDFVDEHPNFEGSGPLNQQGIVETELGVDDKPVLANGYGYITEEQFAQWYNDVPGTNATTQIQLPLVETFEGSGIFSFDSNAYFPVDNQLLGNEGRPHNFHFTTEIQTSFTYQGGEFFNFTGDDDVWVFIDDQLVIDLGGTHSPLSASVDVDSLGLEIGETYDFDIFHAERQTDGSSFKFETSLQFNIDQDAYSYDVDAIDPDNDAVTYSLVDAPAGMTIDSETGVINWDANAVDALIESAKTQTFFGETVNSSASNDVERPDTLPDVDSAQAEFLSKIRDARVESFESFTDGETPQTLNFGDDTATLSGGASVVRIPTGTSSGVFPTDGDNTLLSVGGSGTFEISFDTPQAVFGFKTTDAGDFGGQLVLTFHLAAGGTKEVVIPHTVGANTSGSALFFGVIDAANPFTKVTFANTTSVRDGFGFDELTIGRADQIQLPSVDVTVRATDEYGAYDTQSFTVTPSALGRITGQVWHDLDRDGVLDADEPGLAGVSLYLDANQNDNFDSGETVVQTDSQGRYEFSNLEAGQYTVREILPEAFTFLPSPSGESLVENGSFEDGPDIDSGFVAGGFTIPSWNINGEVDYVHTSYWPASDGEISLDLTGSPTVSAVSQTVDTTAGQAYRLTFDLAANPDIAAGQQVPMRLTVGDESTVFFGFGTGQFDFLDYRPYSYDFVAESSTTILDFASESPFFARGPVLDNVTLRPLLSDFEQVVDVGVGETVSGVNFDNVRKLENSVNQQPIFVSTPTVDLLAVGELWQYQAVATDADQEPLTYELIAGPDGMVVDAQSGLVSWQPTYEDSIQSAVTSLRDFDQGVGGEQLGQYNIILAVKDNQGGVGLQTFRLKVDPDNAAPIISSQADNEAIAELPYEYRVRAQDADGEVVSYRLDAAPSGMSIDETTGVIRWTPTAAQVGITEVTVVVVDNDGAETQQHFSVDVVTSDVAPPNAGPTITSSPRTVIGVGTLYAYQIEASDPNGDPLSYSIVDGPSGLEVDENGLVTWTPQADQLGLQEVTLQVSDGRGGVVVQQFGVGVNDFAPNATPEITSTPDSLGATVGTTYRYDATAFDADGDVVLWRLADAPLGMSIDVEAGTLLWRPSGDQLGNHVVTVEAIDAQGAQTSQRFELTVRGTNLAPLITSIPLTRAATDTLYRYQVEASDIDGDALSYELLSGPAGMSIDAQTGHIEWQPDVDQVGVVEVVVAVNDARGAGSTQRYQVAVEATAPNAAPAIVSQPTGFATVGSAYTYQVVGEDPNGDDLRYELLSGPDGMSIDPVTGALSWQPGSDAVGSVTVAVGAVDPAGLGGAQQFTLQVVANNAAPVVNSTPETTAFRGETYRYDVQAQDPNGDALSYELIDAPDGMSIDRFGRIRWNPTALGTTDVTVAVRDSYGATTPQSFSLTVTEDEVPPEVSVFPSLFPADVNQPLSVFVSATDNVGVVSRTLTIDGETVALTNGTYTFTPDQIGDFTAVATATDAAGNVSQAQAVLQVRDFTTTGVAPTVALVPADQVLTSPTDILGTVSDDNLVSYTLSLAQLGTDNFREIYQGTETVDNGILGQLDTSLFQNDAYTLRLTAEDANGNVVFVDQTVNIAGELKLGNFTLSFTDMELPVSGIPVSVIRTYDSLNANETDDFGYGWRLEFRDTDLRTTVGNDDPLYEQYGIRSLAFSEGDRVYLTLPGGKREGFTFKPQQVQQVDGVPLGLFSKRFFEPVFVADDGSENTLSVKNTLVTQGDDGKFYDFAQEPYNPADPRFGGTYVLTTKAGIEYEIDGTSGDLLSATDLNGNTVTFDEGGIYSDQGTQITFGRDAQGRITSITDTLGQQVSYEYDANGDLVAVTDREENTTRFDYDDEFAHYLDEIIDPLGRSGVKSEYDEQGRLKRLLDVNGEAVEMVYDPENSLQTVKDVFGHPTVYEYDPRGNVVTEIDAVGKVTKRSYDDDDNVLTERIITDESGPEGWTTTYTYDERGNETSRTDALGNTEYYSYNNFGQLLNRTDSLGNTTSYSFDDRGNVLSKTDAAGNITTYTYDEFGNALTIQSGPDDITRYGYDRFGNRTQKVDALGNETTYTYDANGNQLTETMTLTTIDGVRTLTTTRTYDTNGNQTSVLDPEGNLTQYEYDANGNQTAIIDALGRRTIMRYDDKNNLIETILPDDTPNDLSDNPRQGTIYDAAGRRTAITDADGRATTYGYDALDRPTGMMLADDTPNDDTDNPRIIVEYDQAGRMTALVSEAGTRTEYEYDAVGRMIGAETLDSGTTQTTTSTFDAEGRELSRTDALGRTIEFEYDALGQRTATIYPDGTQTQTTYDDAGNVIAETDALGRTTEFEYDALDRLTAVVDALGHRTSYGYDEAGNLVKQTDALGQVTRFEYDGLGRMVATVRPLGQRSETEYDAVGRIIETTDFNGEVITYAYNDLNQLTTKTLVNDGVTIDFSYSDGGKRESVTDERGTTLYDYDGQGRLLSRTEPDGTSVAYTYHPSGQVETLTTPSGVTTYEYTDLNQLSKVVAPNGDETTYTYDEVGNLTQTVRPNGTVQSYEYNDLNRLTYLESQDSAGNVLASYRYTYDDAGNKTSVEELSGRKVEYTYDGLYRLVEEKITDPVEGNRTIAYTFDAVGNRLTKDDSVDGLTTYVYDKNDRLLSETTAEVTTTYTYDANGNLMSEVSPDKQMVYTWSDDNRLVGAEIIDASGTQQVEYSYDADGVRVAKTVDGDETRYLIDTNRQYAQVLEEYDANGTEASYVYGNELISQERRGESKFYLYDGHSGTRQLTDAAGNVTDSYLYDAYGNVLKRIGDTENSYLYRGEQTDSETGLQYLRARYNDLGAGRFISTDPFEGMTDVPMSRHRYLYGYNNPVAFADPSGEIASFAEGVQVFAISSLLTSIVQANFGAIALTFTSGEESYSVWNIDSFGVGFASPALPSGGFEVLEISTVNSRSERVSQLFIALKASYGLGFDISNNISDVALGGSNAILATYFGDNPVFYGGYTGLSSSLIGAVGVNFSYFTIGFGIGWSIPPLNPTSITDFEIGAAASIESFTGFTFPISPVTKEPSFENFLPVDVPSGILPYV